MKASNTLWRERLGGQLAENLAEEIDNFESEIELRRQGKLDEKIFAETRLRRGAYGQRYDNGQRHDGRESRRLPYPEGRPTKGHADVAPRRLPAGHEAHRCRECHSHEEAGREDDRLESCQVHRLAGFDGRS